MEGVDVVRLSYPDLIGIERGKDILLTELSRVAEHGVAFCRAVYHTSPTGETIPVPGGLEAGLPDIHLFPDLSSLVVLPWEPGVAWCLADSSAPEDPRRALRQAASRLGELGLTAIAGPELEYFLLEPAPEGGWRRYGDAPGNVYVAGRKGDPGGHLLTALRWTRDLGLGVTMGNHEYCAGQFEINLAHSEVVDAADRAFRFKAAIQEIARLEGMLATFMAKPFNDEGGSGFHLHLSLASIADDGRNVFDEPRQPYGLSETAMHAIGGIIEHAPAMAALLNPTINSYKRFGPDTLAPWLIDWGLDNRSAMLRIPPERGESARLEVRLGDASANPYLGAAALLTAVYLGIRDKVDPPAPLEGYGYDPAKAAVLPRNLTAALDALEASTEFAALLGGELVTAFVTYKRNEIERFERHVTDWEFTEYAYHL